MMMLSAEKREKIKALVGHYDERIREYERDVSKVAELRAVRTLRDGAMQVLEILGIDLGEKSEVDHE